MDLLQHHPSVAPLFHLFVMGSPLPWQLAFSADEHSQGDPPTLPPLQAAPIHLHALLFIYIGMSGCRIILPLAATASVSQCGSQWSYHFFCMMPLHDETAGLLQKPLTRVAQALLLLPLFIVSFSTTNDLSGPASRAYYTILRVCTPHALLTKLLRVHCMYAA